MIRPGPRLLLAAAALLAVVPAAASLKGWRDGPAGYLLTPEEYQAYGRLADDGERREFIERFWAGVGGGPGAAADFRKTFEERCSVAEERFASPKAPGFRTDRGRVYILLGEPSRTKRETAGLKAVETEVWIYDDGRAGRAPERVSFFRCSDGDYRLDAACPDHPAPFATPPWDTATALQRALERNPGLALARARTFVQAILSPVPDSALHGPGPVAGRPDTAPPAGPEVDEEGAHALEPASYFFRAQDGSVLAILSLELLDGPPAPLPPGERALYAAAVTLAPLQAAARTGEARSWPLRFAPSGTPRGPALFTGAVYLEPGRTYGVRYTVQDLVRETAFLRRARLTAPDLGTGLAVSSIVPAERFGPAADAPDGALRVGSEEVLPKPGAVFARSDMLRLYLQVYGAAEDPRTGGSDLDVVFRFYLQAGGREKRVKRPFSIRRAERASMGLTLPVADWPEGEYRVAVDLHDRITGERVGSQARFRIAGP